MILRYTPRRRLLSIPWTLHTQLIPSIRIILRHHSIAVRRHLLTVDMGMMVGAMCS